MKIRLVTFADGRFASRRNKFLKNAQSLEIFDDIWIESAASLSDEFREQHGAFMERSKRGFGYWIWKPQVILEAFSRSEPDDIVVYIDAGFSLNARGRGRFLEYVEIARQDSSGILSFQNVHTEAHWTKGDLARRVGLAINHPHMLTSQLSSGLIVFRKSAAAIELARHWREIAVSENYRFSDDTSSVGEDHASFKEHRHDQSISSLLRKISGTAVTHYEVQPFSNWFENNAETLPAWATRSTGDVENTSRLSIKSSLQLATDNDRQRSFLGFFRARDNTK